MIENSIKYSCVNCKFESLNKKDYNRHILTAKHIKLVKCKRPKLVTTNGHFICICGKEYKHTQSLRAHEKKCKFESENILVKLPKVEQSIESSMMELIKQNDEFKELLIEQHKQMLQMSQTVTVTNNNNTNNTNNNKFNLNIFLNETCKDALNIMDFVSSIQMQLNDLDNFRELGYVKNISNILIRGLKSLDVCKRPIHCSDLKREIMYVKDQNAWEKDKEQTNMTKAIKKIAFNGVKQIPAWETAHPGYTDPDHKNNDKHLKMVFEMMGGLTDEDDLKNYNKIFRNVLKEVVIGKQLDAC
jgi:hypothetical protein